MRRSMKTVMGVGVVAALILSACSSGSSGGGGQSRKPQEIPPCPLDALNNVTAPVEVTMWHAMAEDNDKVLKKLADQFNASQNKVKVTTVLLTTYDNVLQKVNASKQTGDLAEVAQIETSQMQAAVDSDLFLPAQSCVNAANFSFGDYLPGVAEQLQINNVQQAMPFNLSTSILYYDKSDFVKAGLDPEKPPTTLDEVKDAAKKLKAANASTKAPFSYESDSTYLQQWLDGAGDYFVNGENGREAIPTEALFGNSTGESVFSWLESMRKDGLIDNYKRDDGYKSLFAVGQGDSSMTVWSTAALGTALNILNARILADKDITLGVGQYPGVKAAGASGGGGALFMSKKASPEKIAASWQWLAYLNSAPVQAQWAIGTGFIPATKTAAADPSVQAYWQQQPAFKVGYDQILAQKSNNVTAGPVIGPYSDVRRFVEDAMASVIDQKASGKSQLSSAVSQSNTALQDYADRAGG